MLELRETGCMLGGDCGSCKVDVSGTGDADLVLHPHTLGLLNVLRTSVDKLAAHFFFR